MEPAAELLAEWEAGTFVCQSRAPHWSLKRGHSIKELQHLPSPGPCRRLVLSIRKKLLYLWELEQIVRKCCVAYIRATDINISYTLFWVWPLGTGADIQAVITSPDLAGSVGLERTCRNHPLPQDYSWLTLFTPCHVTVPLESSPHARFIHVDSFLFRCVRCALRVFKVTWVKRDYTI